MGAKLHLLSVAIMLVRRDGTVYKKHRSISGTFEMHVTTFVGSSPFSSRLSQMLQSEESRPVDEREHSSKQQPGLHQYPVRTLDSRSRLTSNLWSL